MDACALKGLAMSLVTGLPRRQCRGEFMVDLAHTTYPDYEQGDYSTADYFRRALKGPCQVRLART